MKSKLYFTTNTSDGMGLDIPEGSVEKIKTLVEQVGKCHEAAQKIFSDPDLRGLLTVSIDEETISQIGINAFSVTCWSDWPPFFASNSDCDWEGHELRPKDDGRLSMVFDGKDVCLRLHCEFQDDPSDYVMETRQDIDTLTDSLQSWINVEKNIDDLTDGLQSWAEENVSPGMA